MWQLYYFPLCPFSRKVRLALAEKGVGYELVREYPWEANDAFYALNHAGRTPVLRLEEKNLTLVDSQAICEYFEETVDKSPLILGSAVARAEIRRLTALFDEIATQWAESLDARGKPGSEVLASFKSALEASN